MEHYADVVIIGGGIIGCATAYYLAKRGISTIVLEAKDMIGDGGSTRNCGGVRQSGRDVRELPIAVWSIENLWPHLSEELGVDVEYVQQGNLRLGKNAEHIKILNQLTENAVACGVNVKMVDGNEIKSINSHLSDDIIGASWCPTDGHANPLTATLGYYKAARKLGVKFYTGIEVQSLKTEKGVIRKVETNEGCFEGKNVLVAAGYESRNILNTVGIDVPMSLSKHETLVTEMQPKMFEQMLGTAEADFYGHQTKHGSFVFGGSTGLEDYYEDYGKMNSSSVGASSICRSIIKYVPELQKAKVVRVWSGMIDQCADGIPVLGGIDEISGLYVACAFSGHGFGIAPGVGYNLAQLIAEGKTTVDLSDFKYDRFKANK